MSGEITIDIDTQGNVVIGTKGVKGPECKQLTKQLEKDIGTVTSSRKTAEYHERPQVQRKVKA